MRLQQRGRLGFKDRPAFLQQRIAHVRRTEFGGVNFNFLADATHHRVFVALRARILVEQRAKAVPWREDASERRLARLELCPLIRGQTGERVAQLRLFFHHAAP